MHFPNSQETIASSKGSCSSLKKPHGLSLSRRATNQRQTFRAVVWLGDCLAGIARSSGGLSLQRIILFVFDRTRCGVARSRNDGFKHHPWDLVERILLHVAFTQRLRHIKPWGPSGVSDGFFSSFFPCLKGLKAAAWEACVTSCRNACPRRYSRGHREQPTNRTICNSGKVESLCPLAPHALKSLQLLRDKPPDGPVSGDGTSLPPAPLSDFGGGDFGLGEGFLLVTRFNLHQGSLSRAPTSG